MRDILSRSFFEAHGLELDSKAGMTKDNDTLGKVTSRLVAFGNMQGEVFKNAQKSIFEIKMELL